MFTPGFKAVSERGSEEVTGLASNAACFQCFFWGWGWGVGTTTPRIPSADPFTHFINTDQALDSNSGLCHFQRSNSVGLPTDRKVKDTAAFLLLTSRNPSDRWPPFFAELPKQAAVKISSVGRVACCL